MRKIFTFLTILSACFSAAFAQNVGVGTPTPVAKLEVASTDSNAVMITNSQPATLAKKTRQYFRNGIYYTGAIGTEVTTETAGAPFAKLSFFTYGSDNPSGLFERMTISDAGYVGINNTNPQSTLDVSGTFKLQNGSEGTGKVLTSDAIGNASWQNTPAATSIVLPYSGALAGTTANLFSIANTSTSSNAAALYGSTASTTGGNTTFGPAGIIGEVTSTAPGGFSSGVKGINRGTANNGIGVLGYQAGNGFGVYGTTATGTGVVGASSTGTGGNFYTTSGTALNVTSPSTGTALSVSGDVRLTGINEGAGKVLTSDAAGNATWQTPAGGGSNTGFVARLSSDLVFTNAGLDVTNFVEINDDGNGFNPSTGVYTTPSAGLYTFKARAYFTMPSSGTNAFIVRIELPGQIEQNVALLPVVTGYGGSVEVNVTRKLAAGVNVSMSCTHSSSSTLSLRAGSASNLLTMFSGYKVY